MLQVGEKVRYLDDVGEATIVKLLDAKTALVEDEYGLKHPHPLNKLVPAERDFVPKQVKPIIPVSKPAVAKPAAKEKKISKNQLPEFCLAFVTSNSAKPESGDLELLFSNASNYHVLINVAAKVDEEWFSLYNGEVLPKSNQLVQSLRRQDVGSVGNLNVDVIFFGSTGYAFRKPISCAIKIKSTRFVKPGNYLEYDKFQNSAIAIEVENPATPAPSITPPKKSFAVKSVRPTSLIFEEEVDLHLEDILGMDPPDMPDHEKFLTQMRHFERRLTHALTHNYIEITFIHGVGTGRLKEAIRQELKEYGLPFQDGPFHKYGVGATVVNLNLA